MAENGVVEMPRYEEEDDSDATGEDDNTCASEDEHAKRQLLEMMRSSLIVGQVRITDLRDIVKL